jgi:chromosome segregation ATPase
MPNGEWKEWSNHVLAELKRFDRAHDSLHSKLDKLDCRMDQYNETLIRNTASLDEHIRRTDLLEKKVESIEGDVHGLKMQSEKPSLTSSLVSAVSSDKAQMGIKILILAASAIASYKLGIKQFVMSLFQ